MPFKKGEGGQGGRPKGVKNKDRLIKYHPKRWESRKHKIYNQDYVIYLLENNLPLDDYIDTLNSKYSKGKKI